MGRPGCNSARRNRRNRRARNGSCQRTGIHTVATGVIDNSPAPSRLVNADAAMAVIAKLVAGGFDLIYQARHGEDLPNVLANPFPAEFVRLNVDIIVEGPVSTFVELPPNQYSRTAFANFDAAATD